jgi:hypothetical protein
MVAMTILDATIPTAQSTAVIAGIAAVAHA